MSFTNSDQPRAPPVIAVEVASVGRERSVQGVDYGYRNAGGKRQSGEPAVVVEEVEGLALLPRLSNGIEDPGDMVALLQRLPYFIWIALRKHLADRR